jgi:hypothetical protein
MPIYSKYTGVGGGTSYTFVGTAPITVTDVAGTVTTSMTQSSSSVNGWLSSTDWTTFNSKQPAGSYANTDLGNLVAPTAINQNLLFVSDNSFTIGANTTSRPSGVNVAAYFSGPVFRGVDNSSNPSLTDIVVRGADMSTGVKNGGQLTLRGGSPVGGGTAGSIIIATDSTARITINATGAINVPAFTASQIVATDASKNLQTLTTATYPSLTELSYVKGVTSAIQTQLDSKQPTLPPQTGNADRVLVTDGSALSWQYAGLGSGSYPTNTVIVGKAKPGSLTGGYNTIIGSGTTANATTTGEQNVYIGYNTVTLYNNSYATSIGNSTVNLGDNTIAIGFNAQAYNGGAVAIGATTIVNDGTVGIGVAVSANAVYSVAIGRGVSSGNYSVGLCPFGKVSVNSVSIGYQAGKLLDPAASQNILIGNTAGDDITTGSSNTIIGDIAGTNTLSNTIILAAGTTERIRVTSTGETRFAATTSGYLGISPAATTTSYSLVFPSAQGVVDTVLANDGSGNLTWQYAGLGAGALGTNNVIVGRAKPVSLSGTQNTIMGAVAADLLTSGGSNLILGYQAGRRITQGNSNIYLGVNAGPNAASFSGGHASNQIAIGVNTLSAMTASGNNGNGVVVGSGAISSGTTHTDFCVVGHSSLSTGNSNASAIFGHTAATSLTAGQSYSQCTLIGAAADSTKTTNTNNAIAIGFAARANDNEFATGSATSVVNTMLIGRGGAAQTAAHAVKIMTMRASGTTNTSMTAGTLTLAGSQGTGTGAGGDVLIATAPASGTGSTTNAHVERMRVFADGVIGINTSNVTVNTSLRIDGGSGAFTSTALAGLQLNTYSSINGSVLYFDRQRGTVASPTNIQSGDNLGFFAFRGYGGGLSAAAGSIECTASENWSGTAWGNYLSFSTTANTTTTRTERLRITDAGDVKVQSGQLSVETAGKGLSIKEGANAKMGITGTFPTGSPNTVTVSTTAVTANSRIFLTAQSDPAGVNAAMTIASVTAGTSFDIRASNTAFNGTVAWMIVEPA